MTESSTGKLKSLIELIGAGAILAGLVFVGLELRQNTAAVQADTFQNLTALTTEYMLLLATDENLNRLNRKGRADLSSLDETEASQFFNLRRTTWLRMQLAFLQWRRGTLDDEGWAFYRQFLCSYGNADDWQDHRNALLGSFVEVVESCD